MKDMILLPEPKEIEPDEGTFSFPESWITCKEEEILSDEKVIIRRKSGIRREEYAIIVREEKITIICGDNESLFRAVTTLKQIIVQSDKGIPCMKIIDYPSISNRGLMLDVSRGKMPQLAELKKLVDILTALKYNQLQLYMDSFVFAYKNFPEYCADTQPYTASQIAELERYCRERFIELVPNQNGFGHMEKWLEKPELAPLGIERTDGKKPSTLDPFAEGSLELADKIYDGFLDLFSANKANIGMDEPFDLGMGQTKEMCERYGKGKVYTDYLNKICRLVKSKYRKTPMFWDDIIFKHEEQIKNIPPDSIVMEWGYEGEQHFDRNCAKLRENKLRFYVCPGTSSWGSVTGRTNNMIFNIASAAEAGAHYGAEGFLLTDWGDGGHPQFPAISMFAYVFGGACSWSGMSNNTEKAYEQRSEMIKRCKKYTDKFIFGTEKQLCSIINRAGNYYLAEDELVFNNTKLILAFNRMINDETADMPTADSCRDVAEYMEKIIDKLRKTDKNDYADEALVDCRIVKFIADCFIASYEKQSIPEYSDIIDEYRAQWLKRNKSAGCEIFINNLHRFAEIVGKT